MHYLRLFRPLKSFDFIFHIAVTLQEYVKERPEGFIDLFVLDGTWKEAKSLYFNCKFLHNITKVGSMGKSTKSTIFQRRTQSISRSLTYHAADTFYIHKDPCTVHFLRIRIT